MTRRIMVTLDSGAFFLPPPAKGPLEIGYFSCHPSSSDFQVYADGRLLPPPLQKVNGCEVSHASHSHHTEVSYEPSNSVQTNDAVQNSSPAAQQTANRKQVVITFEHIGGYGK